MKPVALYLTVGLLFSSLSAYAQQPLAPATDSAPAQTPVPSTVQAPTQTPTQTPAAPAPAAGAANLPDVGADYVLGIQDEISVNVWKEPTITGNLTIRPDGKISLPLVGDVEAAGLTPMALAADITTRLKKFINDPTVTVTVIAVNSRRVFFIGEVNHPGPLPLTRDMTMLQAISSVGGLTPYADKSHIIIQRKKDGKTLLLKFDYKKALKDGNEQGVTLQPGDTILVK